MSSFELSTALGQKERKLVRMRSKLLNYLLCLQFGSPSFSDVQHRTEIEVQDAPLSKMSFHFTGAGRTRAPVTLGGTSSISADPARSAREQRLERQEQRRKYVASVRIQSQARRILQSRRARAQWQQQSRQLLDHSESSLQAGTSADTLPQLVLGTRALLFSLGPASRTLDESDTHLFLRWVKLVSQSINGTQLVLLPFNQPHQNATLDSWLSLLRLACKHSLRFLDRAATSRAQEPSATISSPTSDVEILAFLGLITGVDPASPANSISLGKQSQTLASSLLSLLLHLGLHRTLRSHILSFSSQQRPQPLAYRQPCRWHLLRSPPSRSQLLPP